MTRPLEEYTLRDGQLTVSDGHRVTLDVLQLLPVLQAAAEAVDTEAARQRMYEAGRRQAARATHQRIADSLRARLLQRFSRGRTRLLAAACATLSKQGFGRLELVTAPGDDAGRIHCRNGFEAAHRAPADEPVCSFIRGTVTGIVNIIYKQEFAVAEEQCAATGATHCVFSIEPV